MFNFRFQFNLSLSAALRMNSMIMLLSPLALIANAGNLSPVSIRFMDQTSVEGEQIKLGEIARIIAGDEKVVAKLETLQVAKSAGFGLSRMIDTDLLFNQVLKAFDKEYLFDIERKLIRVTTKARVLPNDTLAKMVTAFLNSQQKLPGQIRNWEIVQAPAQIFVPLSNYKMELAFVGSRRKGKVELNLSIKKDTKNLRNIAVTLNLRQEEPVLVAKAKIERGSILTSENTSVEIHETTLINDLVLTAPEKLVGNMAKVTLIPGRIVTPNMVALPPLVKKGQGVKIVLTNGAVSISSEAICRQDGVSGQIITAKSLANNRLMRVRVTDNGFLEPVPGG